MLRKKTQGIAIGSQNSSFIGKATQKVVDRRSFIKGSGLAIGGLAVAASVVGPNIKSAQAKVASGPISIKKSVCTHLSLIHISEPRDLSTSRMPSSA